MRGKTTIAAAAAVLGALALAGVAAASVTPPPAIKSAGQIVFCTDATYPPEESIPTGSTKPIGSDIDIGTAVAAQMGVKASFKNTTFDSIIAALKAKKCDAVISGMNDTAQRRKQVDFVDYLKVGQSIMVKAGNPEHLPDRTVVGNGVVHWSEGTDLVATVRASPEDTPKISLVTILLYVVQTVGLHLPHIDAGVPNRPAVQVAHGAVEQ